jgi:hypothetical protein
MKLLERRRNGLVLAGSVFAAVVLASPAQGATTNFFEGFEAGLVNWVVGDANPSGTPAYWGPVTSTFGGEATHGGAFKAYCAATGYAGSISSPAYRDYMNAYLSRTIDLTGYTNATLSFWHKIPTIESGYDYARVLVDSTELWSTDQPRTSWQLMNLSLESYIGGIHELRFEFSSDLSNTGEGWYLDDVTLTDAFTPPPPPTNDNFSAAKVIAGALGSAGGSNRGATSEAGEPNPGNSIWYRWTPYTNGIVTFRTGGSAFDTLLCVYTGSTLATLATVACDDNGDTNGGSKVTFNAVAGTAYRISVRGVGGASGFVLLSWTQPNGLGVDLLPDLFVWPSAPNGFLYGWYLDQNEGTQPGRTLMRVSTATPNIGSGPLELRGSSTEAGVYQRVYRADGSTYDRYAGTFTFHPGHGHLHFDNWINLHLRTVLVNDGVGDIVASGDKTSFAIIDLMVYNGSLPGSPPGSVYFGGLVQGLSVGYADVYSADLLDQWIDVTDVPSGRYWLEGIVDPANSILESNESNNLARILINYVNPNGTNRPVNDAFTNAIELLTITAAVLGHNTNATLEPGEPLHLAGSTTGHSVWWRWTAPSDMTATISTDGSGFDTVLAVYTGPSYAGLIKVASDNDSGAGTRSLVTFAATEGTTYHIAVAGLNTSFGKIQLNVNPGLNDHFANCLPISGVSGSATVSTLGATRQSGEPNHAGVVGTNSVWFCWTAPDNGPWILDTYGSSFDTLLAVYTGDAVNALTTIAANDNLAVGVPISRVSFTAISNTTYHIAVDGRAGASGSGIATLNWTGPTPPRITAQPQSTNVIAGATVNFNVTAAGSVPLSYQWLHAGTNLTANSRYIGTTGSQLRLQKVLPTDLGDYSVVISNAYGMVTSAPAFLIVLDNPRVVYVDEATAPIGGVAVIPIEMQSLGDEGLVRFTLAFDPALLSNPRFTNSGVMSAAALTVNATQVSSGRLGVSMTLPTGQSVPAGSHQELARAFFDVTNTAANGTVTSLGFENSPTTRGVILTNSLAAVTLFAAGPITLTTGESRVFGERLPDGTFRITVLGLAGGNYEIQASSDLQNWTELTQLTADPHGGLEFIDPQSTVLQHRFYRALRLAP